MAEPNHQYESPLVCRICSKSCETKPKLFNHLREKHEIGRKISKCFSCSYTTDRAGNLRRHIRLVHDERSKSHHHRSSRRPSRSRSHSRSRSRSRSRYHSRRRTRSRSPHHEEATKVRKIIIKEIPRKNSSPAISVTCSPTLTTPSPMPSGKQLSVLLQTLERRPPSATSSECSDEDEASRSSTPAPSPRPEPMENRNIDEQNLEAFPGPLTPVPSLPDVQHNTQQGKGHQSEETHAGKILATVQQKTVLRYFYGGQNVRQKDDCETYAEWIPATWNKNVNCNVGFQK